MQHDNLWAPWRLGYIQNAAATPAPAAEALAFLPGADAGCFICRGLASPVAHDRENLIVARGRHTVVILNRYPYNNGHLLVAPLLHKGELDQMDDAELLECQQVLARFSALERRLLNAEGFNIGLNLGRVAGAGLPGHLHWHIVPRWNGDTNFMASLAGARVIPQSLEALWDLLATHLASY